VLSAGAMCVACIPTSIQHQRRSKLESLTFVGSKASGFRSKAKTRPENRQGDREHHRKRDKNQPRDRFRPFSEALTCAKRRSPTLKLGPKGVAIDLGSGRIASPGAFHIDRAPHEPRIHCALRAGTAGRSNCRWVSSPLAAGHRLAVSRRPSSSKGKRRTALYLALVSTSQNSKQILCLLMIAPRKRHGTRMVTG
jgi:hypothetical protein